jgi:hypothetical protein
VTALEQRVCPHEDATDPGSFAARLAVLEADHIPSRPCACCVRS